MSHTRGELLERSGSRYAPASACDSLDLIESAPSPCVFIGQPSEVTALRKAERLRPALAGKVGLAMSFLCAGSPARLGTIEFLKSMGIPPEDVTALRYRGNGWPGMFSVTVKGEPEPTHFRTYKESWSYVQRYRPLSTHLCPDGSGEDADISCGDPWYRDIQPNEPGSSIVIVRTETGRRILEEAMKSGCVRMTPAESWKLSRSQQNLIEKRGAVGGRILTLLAMGVPVTRLRGFSLLKNWLRLPLKEKLRSTVGTIKRALSRRYYRPIRNRGSYQAARTLAPAVQSA